ncbi:Xylose isomerase domain protein TIM barrel (fragment) [Candidatus Sulfopaludibacter sp. SbA4]
MWPDARASDVARFLALAKSGHPYERDMVVEDVAGRSNIETFAAALQYQQRDHMERSVEYGKKVLDLGVKWRA